MWRSSRVLASAVVLLVAPLAACSDEDESRPAPVGTVIDSDGSSAGHYVRVEIPDGRIDVTIADPVQDLAILDDDYDRAADGASFIAVGWSWEFASAYRAMAPVSGTDRIEPHLWLVADGEDYSLDEATLRRNDEDPVSSATDSPLDFNGTAYVVVPGEPRDLAIKVEFDGVEQTIEVDDPGLTREGPAAALYAAPDELAQHDVGCGPARVQPARIDDSRDQCLLSIARVPYVAPLGWVEDRDARWLSLITTVRPQVFPVPVDGGSACGGGTEIVDVRYRLDGKEPVLAQAADPAGGRDPIGRDRVVFASGRPTGATSELVITATQDYLNPDPGCPRSLRLTWRVEV